MPKDSSPTLFLPLLVAMLFLGGVASLALIGKLSIVVPCVYLGASLLAFLAYAKDKAAAKKDDWRVPENTLHFLGLIGGWPGALAAQRIFRHKTRKFSFQFAFWFTAVLNCSALSWFVFETWR